MNPLPEYVITVRSPIGQSWDHPVWTNDHDPAARFLRMLAEYTGSTHMELKLTIRDVLPPHLRTP